MCFASTQLVIGCFLFDIAIHLTVPPQPAKSAAQGDAFIQHLPTGAGSVCLSVYNTQKCVMFNFVTLMPTVPNLVAMGCLKDNNSTPDVGVLLRLMIRQSV